MFQDILNATCVTPDCQQPITGIKYRGSDGEINKTVISTSFLCNLVPNALYLLDLFFAFFEIGCRFVLIVLREVFISGT